MQRGKLWKGGCWSEEALLKADKGNTSFLGRELLTAVVDRTHRAVETHHTQNITRFLPLFFTTVLFFCKQQT